MSKKKKIDKSAFDTENRLFKKVLSAHETKKVLETMRLIGLEKRAVAVGMGLKLFNETYNPNKTKQ